MAKLPANTQQVAHDLAALCEGSVSDIRARACRTIGNHFDAEMCAGFSIRQHHGTAYYCEAGLHCRDPAAARGWMALDGTAPVAHGKSWLETVRVASNLGRFVSIDQLSYSLRDSPAWGLIYEPYGFTRQLRMLVADGPRFVGWIGLIRRADRPDWSVRERRTLASLVPTIETVMRYRPQSILADHSEGPQTLVMCGDGQVDFATAAAAKWNEAIGHTELRTRVRELHRAKSTSAVFVIHGVEVRLARVCGAKGVRYTAVLAPLDSLILGARVLLSPRQREVAEAYVTGASSQQVGANIGLSQETVRGYLKDIYKRLDVRSRLELAERMRR